MYVLTKGKNKEPMYYTHDWATNKRYAMDNGHYFVSDLKGTLTPVGSECLLLDCMTHMRPTGCISLLYSPTNCEYAVYDESGKFIVKQTIDITTLRSILTKVSKYDACMDTLVRTVAPHIRQYLLVLDNKMCRISNATEGWERIFA